MAKTEIDYMEYSSDALAQAAYVSSDVTGYGSDFLTGGTASADSILSGSYLASYGSDDDTGTLWISANTAYPHWWKYDLGVSVTKTVTKLRMISNSGESAIKDFVLAGSNNDSGWTDIHTGQQTDNQTWQEYTFDNSTAYRYYKVTISSTWGANTYTNVAEFEMMEIVPNLQSYSESTIKTQGSYSLKGIAVATDSLNDTLTRTVDPTIDLSDQDVIKMDIRASRTGSNIKIGFHDSGGTTTEHTANIASANEWQTENIDISGVANVNKDAIDSIIVTITNADAAGTFYLDNIYATIPALGNAIFFGANF